MSYAYTPGLTVSISTIVRRERILPTLGKIEVNVGDYVNADQIVARTFVPGSISTTPIAYILGCEPYELPRVMFKKEGDDVETGEVIGEVSSFFGLFKNRYTCQTTGKLEFLSTITGMMAIRESPIPLERDAYISGKVVDVVPQTSCTIETPAAMVQGILGIGGENKGELMTVAEPDEELTTNHIGEDCANKIIVGGNLVTSDVLKKAGEAEVKGIIVGGMKRNDLTGFLGYELGVAITGNEDITLSCMITEGFGKMNMAKHTFELLKSLEGRFASMNGATQIRAGVIRPEVIIPLKEALPTEESKDLAEGMFRGTRVRIIRQPYFGVIGDIEALPVELQTLETGSKVRATIVKLQNGENVMVPRANVEIISD